VKSDLSANKSGFPHIDAVEKNDHDESTKSQRSTPYQYHRRTADHQYREVQGNPDLTIRMCVSKEGRYENETEDMSYATIGYV